MTLYAKQIKKVFSRGGAAGGSFCALETTDLSLAPGQITEITGRSGSGKSTLLQIMAGLLRPSEGAVLFGDRDLYSLPDQELSRLRNRHIGVIPQGHTALSSMTLLENVMLPARLYGAADAGPWVEKLLEIVGIQKLRQAMPSELSGGEMRRLAIARALVQKPVVVLADEPTGDLDDENTAAVLQLLRKIADEGAAVLLVTHEAAAAEYADAIYTMSAGVLRPQEK